MLRDASASPCIHLGSGQNQCLLARVPEFRTNLETDPSLVSKLDPGSDPKLRVLQALLPKYVYYSLEPLVIRASHTFIHYTGLGNQSNVTGPYGNQPVPQHNPSSSFDTGVKPLLLNTTQRKDPVGSFCGRYLAKSKQRPFNQNIVKPSPSFGHVRSNLVKIPL